MHVAEKFEGFPNREPADADAGTIRSIVLRYLKNENRRAVIASAEPAVFAALDNECDRLIEDSQAAVDQVADVQSASLVSIVDKMDLWFLDSLSGDETRADTASDRLLLSVRRDIRRLLGIASTDDTLYRGDR